MIQNFLPNAFPNGFIAMIGYAEGNDFSSGFSAGCRRQAMLYQREELSIYSSRRCMM